MMFSIRDATPDDISFITKIYNDAVKETTSMWATQTLTAQNRLHWLKKQQDNDLPVLIAYDQKNKALGYGYYTAWMDFPVYRYTMEDSVYVKDDQQRQGIGLALLRTLIEYAQQHDVRTLIAGIDSKNIPSLKLHSKAGFQKSGYLPQVAYKFGQWLDLTYMTFNLKQELHK